jgi:hypothetical protein
MRRRRKAPTPETKQPEPGSLVGLWTGTRCSVCKQPQYNSPSGATCYNGHGGASPEHDAVAARWAKERNAMIEAGRIATGPIEAREGDVLVVNVPGVKLQIASYSTVEIDGGTYSRKLEKGDDVNEQFDRIHSFLRDKQQEKARLKLGTFADELRRARERAGTKEG